MDSMKVLYDHQIFTLQKFGGISRYFVQIINNINRKINLEVSLKYSDNIYIKGYDLFQNISPIFEPYRPIDKFLNGINFKGKGRIFKFSKKYTDEILIDSYFLNKKLSIEYLKSHDFDIFHPTYYDDYFLPFLGSRPFVLTIHDMIHELYPELLNDFETIRRKSLLAKKAAHIIAVSENTKKDIINILGTPKEKISVIYHSNSLIESDKNLMLPKNYILYVGERQFYKNFLFLVEALEPILREDLSLKVVCVGSYFSSNELKMIEVFKMKERFVNIEVSDEELFGIYKNAKVLVFPSYYEGFGIPILEAFYARCPVVVCRTGSSQEIAGVAAFYFKHKNIDQMRGVISEALYNSRKREEYIQKGSVRLEDFSWQSASDKTLEIYKGLV